MAESNPIPRNPRFINLTGKRFGRLLVTGYAGMKWKSQLWFCACDCGSQRTVAGGNLVSKLTRSCGCFKAEQTGKRFRKHGSVNKGVYQNWLAMRRRCKPNSSTAKNHAGRGIVVCPRWDSFAAFASDMGPRPSPSHSIERIDNNGNYEPQNCHWATSVEQARNMRTNRMLSFQGKTQCLAAWAEEVNLPRGIIKDRLRLGWQIERALTTPIRARLA